MTRTTWSAIVLPKELALTWLVDFKSVWNHSDTTSLRQVLQASETQESRGSGVSRLPSQSAFCPHALPACPFSLVRCTSSPLTSLQLSDDECDTKETDLESNCQKRRQREKPRRIPGKPKICDWWSSSGALVTDDLSCHWAWASGDPAPTEETAVYICHIGQRRKGVGWGKGLRFQGK